MSTDPDVEKWMKAQRDAKARARKALAIKVLPAAIVVGLLGTILGAIHWNDVRRRREVEERLAREAAIAVPAEKIAHAKSILEAALAARADAENARRRAVISAYRDLRPSEAGQRCPLPVEALSATDLMSLTGFDSDRGEGAHGGDSHRSADLRHELSMIDLRVRDRIGSGETLGDELVASATRTAAAPEPPFDFQLVVTDHVEPTPLSDHSFAPGRMRGVLLAYDTKARAVVCSAVLASTSSSNVSVRKSGDPVFGKDDPRAAISGDLYRNLFEGAGRKLTLVVAGAPTPEPSAAKPRPTTK